MRGELSFPSTAQNREMRDVYHHLMHRQIITVNKVAWSSYSARDFFDHRDELLILAKKSRRCPLIDFGKRPSDDDMI